MSCFVCYLLFVDSHCCTAIVTFAHELEALLNFQDTTLKEKAFRTVRKAIVVLWPGAPTPPSLPQFLSRYILTLHLTQTITQSHTIRYSLSNIFIFTVLNV
jgi:hypothetical protein